MTKIQKRLNNLDMKGLLDVEESLFDTMDDDKLAMEAANVAITKRRNKVMPLRSNEQIEEMTIFGSILNG